MIWYNITVTRFEDQIHECYQLFFHHRGFHEASLTQQRRNRQLLQKDTSIRRHSHSIRNSMGQLRGTIFVRPESYQNRGVEKAVVGAVAACRRQRVVVGRPAVVVGRRAIVFETRRRRVARRRKVPLAAPSAVQRAVRHVHVRRPPICHSPNNQPLEDIVKFSGRPIDGLIRPEVEIGTSSTVNSHTDDRNVVLSTEPVGGGHHSRDLPG